MNPLFWTILAAVALGTGIQTWVRHRGDDRPEDRTVSFRDDADWPLADDQWSIRDVAFLATSDRVRAVVTIELDCEDSDRRRRAVEKLAREVYRHTEVEAVFVEARRPDADPDLTLFAPDGRGWWGDERVRTAIGGPDFEAEKQP